MEYFLCLGRGDLSVARDMQAALKGEISKKLHRASKLLMTTGEASVGGSGLFPDCEIYPENCQPPPAGVGLSKETRFKLLEELRADGNLNLCQGLGSDQLLASSDFRISP